MLSVREHFCVIRQPDQGVRRGRPPHSGGRRHTCERAPHHGDREAVIMQWLSAGPRRAIGTAMRWFWYAVLVPAALLGQEAGNESVVPVVSSASAPEAGMNVNARYIVE